jgi:hypothetical protein
MRRPTLAWPRPQRSGLAGLAVVIVACALVLVASLSGRAGVRSGADTARTARSVPVDSTIGVCPEAGSAAPLATAVAFGVPPAASSTVTARPGTAVLTALGSDSPLAQLTGPGRSTSVTTLTGPDPRVVRATGNLAPGFAGQQLSRALTGRHRGLASTPCASTGNEFWFGGPGAVTGERARLYLTNPGPVPVVVDVDLYGPAGPLRAPSVRGLTVAPGAQQVRLLDAVAPGVGPLGIHVSARQGRISAAVRDERIDGLVPRGFDWAAPVTAPGRRSVVTGVPSGSGTRTLTLLNPGADDAIVRLTVIGAQGSFVPQGLDVIDVQAGSVASVAVEKLVATDGATLSIDADHPVTAAVVADVVPRGSTPGELAFAGAAEPVADGHPGLLPRVPVGAKGTTRLSLASVGGEVRLDLVPLGPDGPGRPVPVVVAAGALLQVDPFTGQGPGVTAVAVVVREGSAPVYAAAVVRETLADGEVLTVLPVSPGVQSLDIPELRPGLVLD